MNTLALIVGALMALTNSDTSSSTSKLDIVDWRNFKELHGKSYENQYIDAIRSSIFAQNKRQVDEFHSSQPEAEMFQLGLNQYADLSQFEVALMNGFRLPKNELTGERELLINSPDAQAFLDQILNDTSIEVPDELDWRKVPGRVSGVKNQGQCGSCWAFATTGALEGQERVRSASSKSNLTELSEQNLVDCDKKDNGCNGGFMKDAMDFIKREGGIDDEKSYPYEAKDRKCRFRKDKVAITDAGAAILPIGDEEKLKEVVAKFGPVAVAIDASSLWFQLYRRGVYVNKRCKNKEDELDHGVLIVGYGTDPKKGDYWIVKNSWGASWGEKGYIRMARNRKNMCGIASVATIPTF